MTGYANTTGGEGGQVLTVTSLADSGPDTLREACGATFKRVVRFDSSLAGIVQLNSELRIEDDCTLDGIDAQQIVVTGARLAVKGSNVIVRNMRISPLDGPGQSLGERDCIGVGNIDRTISHILIEQNSLKWSTDECGGTWYGPTDVTFLRNLFLQPLENAGHPQGSHAMGSLIGNGSKRITVAQNVFAACEYRSPDVKGDCSDVEIFNNLIVSWGNMGLQLFSHSNTVVAGNMFFPGAQSNSQNTRQMMLHGGQYYVWDNVPQDWELRSGASVTETMPPGFVGSGYLSADWIDPASLFDILLQNAGAIFPRHADDQTIIDMIVAGNVPRVDSETIQMLPVTWPAGTSPNPLDLQDQIDELVVRMNSVEAAQESIALQIGNLADADTSLDTRLNAIEAVQESIALQIVNLADVDASLDARLDAIAAAAAG